jgi:curved DNA-binding protein CbpA
MFSADDPYEVLGLRRNASAAEIKRAFKRLALKHHPDRNPGDPRAARRFARICSAFNQIADPESRERLRAAREHRAQAPASEPACDPTPHAPGADRYAEEWEDLCPTPEEIASLGAPPSFRPFPALGIILIALVLLVVIMTIVREQRGIPPEPSDGHVKRFLESMDPPVPVVP